MVLFSQERTKIAEFTGQSGIPFSRPFRPEVLEAKVAPSFGETPPSVALKQLLGVHFPSRSPAFVGAAGMAATPPGFGEGAQSLVLKGLLGITPSPLSPAAFMATPPGFGETPPSKVLKGLLGLNVSSSSQAAVAASPVHEELLQVSNPPSMTSTALSSSKSWAGNTEAPAHYSWETKPRSELPQGLLKIGDSPTGLGRDEAGADGYTPSLPSANASAAVYTPAAVAINLGGGAASLRPPPGFERTPQLTPILATLPTNAVFSPRDDIAGLPPPPGFGPSPQIPPLPSLVTGAVIPLEGHIPFRLPPPGFGPTPHLPPSAATGGNDTLALLPSAVSDGPFVRPPSSLFRGRGPPPGFGPSPPLREQQDVGLADVIFSSDFAPCPPRSFGVIDHDPKVSGGGWVELDDIDHGRFGFIGGLASLDQRFVKLGRRLGQGGCAVVYKLEVEGVDRKNTIAEYTGGADLVVKVVPEGGSIAQEMSMKRELRVVKQIPSKCHPNIMSIVSMSEEKLSMVMPAASCDLRDLLEDKIVLSSMSFAGRMMMMAGAARGLHYLHSELGLTHGDVKPENCLLDKGLNIKIADFGLSGSSSEPIGGLTKQYAAPEAIAAFQRQDIAKTTTLQAPLDLYAFGVMMIQVLFMEEESRFGGKELATHGMTPKHPSFDAAFKNSLDLYERFEATGRSEDRQRLEDANAVMVDLHIDYAAQTAKMGDLRSTILDQQKWNQPQELLFQEEVTLTLLSLLNKNPHRRASLDTVTGLLECPPLWSAATAASAQAPGRAADNDIDNGSDDYCRPCLPQDVWYKIDRIIGRGLLVDPDLDTPNGVWWEAPEFQFPWWDIPPPIERLVL